MKKNLLLRLCLMMSVALTLYSCRQELLMQDGDDTRRQTSNYKVYTINRSQVTQDFFLFDKVAKIQTTLSEKKTGSAFGKTGQDSLMEGGNIVIDKVLVVESNGQKTYTFPLKRNYPTSKIENLVLKKNQDSTFSGKLIQYDLTLKERELFNSWHSINLNNRVKVFNIENLNLSSTARVGSVSFGCFTILYEDGECSGEEHHPYGDTSCPLLGTSQQAGEPRILAIKEIPGCGDGGGDTGGTGNGTMPSQPSNGGDNGLTIIFDDIDLTYYTSNNMTDPDFLLWSKVNQFVQVQPQIVKNFNNEYHFVYYYIHSYFKNNGGVTQANKDFVSQRLLKLSEWYYDFTRSTHIIDKLSVAIWSERYLFEHPDITWEEFESRFLMNPCEKVKNTTDKVNGLKNKLTSLNTPANLNLNYEKGATIKEDDQGNTSLIPKDGNSGQTSIVVETPADGSVVIYMHTHFNGTNMTPTFTFEDLITLDAMHYWRFTNNKPINKVTMYVITSEGTFAMIIDNSIRFYNMGGKLLTAEKEYMRKEFYGDLEEKVNVSVNNYIKQVAKSLPDYGLSLYKATDSNLNGWNKVVYNTETDELIILPCN